MKKLYISIAIASFPLLCQAQTEETTSANQHTWQQYFDQLSDYDDIESGNLEDIYDQMCDLETAPIDLNNATGEDINRLTFLSATQKEELTEYLDRYRPIHSMGELSMIKSIDPMRLQLLKEFTFIGNGNGQSGFPDMKSILKYGKNELVATANVPLYTRKGDRNGYLGYKYKHWFRYAFKYGQYLQIGLSGTQDAGEPFFSGGNSMGYDHYAYYAIVRKMGMLKTLAVGQYRLRFGLGLIMNTGFSLGKTTALAMSTPTNSISANASRSDAYYLQGAAATIAVSRHIDITAFASYRKIDATLNDNGTIKTLLKTGYHRTVSEMQRKHNTSQTTTGGSIRWHSGGWHAGASGIFTSLNRTLSPNTSQLFRQHYPTGDNFYNASADYGFINHRLNINGETAINDNGAIATLNAIAIKASQSLTLTAIQRYYSYRYYSLYSSSFSDGGSIQNESGVYVGANWTPLPRLSLLIYSDYAYFPWARYGISAASHSWDNMLQTTYTLSKCLALTARYRLRMRQEDYSPDTGDGNEDTSKKTLIDKTEHRGRIALCYNGTRCSAKTQADIAYTTFPTGLKDKPNSFGWMLSETAGYNFGIINAGMNIGYFHTRDYNSRLYTYERGMLYTFSFPMFYGEGMRAALFMRGNIGNNLVIIGKAGMTKYFDRNKISSSYQEINGSSQTDIDIQIKWKF